MKSAVGILGVMKQANVIPSAETYTTLLCGYAKNGDITAIKEVLSQCEQEDIYISDRDILEVIYTLAINKHTDHIDQVCFIAFIFILFISYAFIFEFFLESL